MMDFIINQSFKKHYTGCNTYQTFHHAELWNGHTARAYDDGLF